MKVSGRSTLVSYSIVRAAYVNYWYLCRYVNSTFLNIWIQSSPTTIRETSYNVRVKFCSLKSVRNTESKVPS